MGLPRLSIKHPVSTLMIMLICIVIGATSLISSPLELMPNIHAPIAVVMTIFPGASPEEVSTLVTKPLEDSVATASGLSNLSSTSQESMSMLMLQFAWGTDMIEARADLQQVIDRVNLPEGAQKPSLIKFDPNMMPVMEMTAANGENLADLKRKIDADVVPRLEKVDGVAAVFVTGTADREIQVRLNQDKLTQYGLTQTQVASLIQASNLTYPAGNVNIGDQSLNLRIVGKTNAIDDLKSLVTTLVPDMAAIAANPAVAQKPAGAMNAAAAPAPGAMPTGAGAQGAAMPSAQIPMKAVRLSDLAEIEEGFGDATVINRTNGQPSLRITVQKEGEANTVDVTRALQQELEQIEKDHPDLDLITVMNQGDLISQSVNNVSSSLVGGGILAVLILLLFLRNLRPTLIIGVAIPFSVIVTFVLTYLNDLTLNIMTLGGLALGVGMLVDNAIVVIENIYRRMNELGEDPYTAAERGANEVAGAITSSTLTTIAVFLPVVFVGGLTGELFKELALTVTFSLVASLAVALTVIPMMASRFLKPQQPKTGRSTSYVSRDNAYTGLLRWALKHRAVTLLAAVAMLAGSLALVPRIGTEFMPAMDEGQFTIAVKMPPGTSLATVAAKVQAFAAIVDKEIPTALITTSAGRPEGLAGLAAAMGGGGAADGEIKVTVKEDYGRPTMEAIASVREALEQVKGDAAFSFTLDNAMMSMGGSTSNSVQVVVTGPDQAKVRELVGQVQERMGNIEGVKSLENNLDTSKPELQIVVNQEKAMLKGLAPAQVAMTMADAVKGKIVTRVEAGGVSTDVRVLYRPEDRNDTTKLESILLKSPLGTAVPLRDVAEVKQALGPVNITRENQKASAQISGLIEGRDLGSVTMDVNTMVQEISPPDGYTVKAGGASQMMGEGFGGLTIALVLAVLLIYMIMAAQFESLLHPFTILLTMPLAVIGVIVGLFVSGYALGITAMIGIIILAGVVVNNGIVLIDFVNQLRQSGMELTEAIVEAGRTRIRPIFMTALTTMLGLLPLALGIGDGAEIQAPMAVAVIGGLLTSTVLTLVVIPVIYHLFAGRRSVTVNVVASQQ
ncbi:MAG TPA: efflux RND transporter permease subunit [Symbiobacteriaceae bacterium]|nr:efflux RND transporter permease subunit [Symbiobacteriaceae bacterium]